MEDKDWYAHAARAIAQRAQELNEKYGNYRAAKEGRYSVDTMPVIVDYTAVVGRLAYFNRGEEYVFMQTKSVPDETGMLYEEVGENAYSIRDEFFKVETVGQAIEFLQKTGEFSPLRPRLTWKEFQKWQLFARLVQEHNELGAAMRSNSWSGDCGEVLKALTGIYPCAFFDGCEDSLYVNVEPFRDPSTDPETSRRLEEAARAMHEAPNHEECLKAFEREKQELQAQDAREKWEREKMQAWRALWQWFIKPPVSIEWRTIDNEAAQKMMKQRIDTETGVAIPIPEESPLLRGGAMIEFLLPQDQLRPVLVIQPKCTLQAIAAAIYAERIQGISYRKCGWCEELFKIGSHKDKRYCDSARCKSNARKQRQRAKQRKEKELAASKQKKSKAKQTRRP